MAESLKRHTDSRTDVSTVPSTRQTVAILKTHPPNTGLLCEEAGQCRQRQASFSLVTVGIMACTLPEHELHAPGSTAVVPHNVLQTAFYTPPGKLSSEYRYVQHLSDTQVSTALTLISLHIVPLQPQPKHKSQYKSTKRNTKYTRKLKYLNTDPPNMV